jgi:hypothetical protein
MQQHSIRPFGLRMDNDLKGWIANRAEENGRSLNSEIIQLLKSERRREDAKRMRAAIATLGQGS